MTPYRILIVEDEVLIARDIEILLNKIGYRVVKKAKTVAEAKNALENYRVDLALVDINLEHGEEGIYVAGMLTKAKLPFIYITSYSDENTVRNAMQTKPDAYIVKPVSMNDLYTNIEMVMYKQKNKQQDTNGPKEKRLKLTHHNKKIFLDPKDIYWIKADGVYMEIETEQNTYVERGSFNSLLSQISDPNILKVHRGWVVNTRYINEFKTETVRIKDVEIPVSRSYRKDLKASL